MSESIADKLARIGDEAEAAENDQTERPLPDHVKVSQPGRARSRVLQVRLNPDEYQALQELADQRNLPVSTIAREQLLKLTTGDSPSANSAVMKLADVLSESIREGLREILLRDVPSAALSMKGSPNVFLDLFAHEDAGSKTRS